MSDDKNNPRKLQMAIRCFQQGLMGHRFSRPLSKAEGARIREMILANRHGCCIFTDAETGAAVGAWLCSCEECEVPLILFAAEAKVSVIAQARGEKSFLWREDDDTVNVETQTIGAHEQARSIQVASVASQVATQVSGEIAAKVSANIAKEVSQQTVAAVLENAGQYCESDEAQLKVVFHGEKPN